MRPRSTIGTRRIPNVTRPMPMMISQRFIRIRDQESFDQEATIGSGVVPPACQSQCR
jgi:hypothetical protein